MVVGNYQKAREKVLLNEVGFALYSSQNVWYLVTKARIDLEELPGTLIILPSKSNGSLRTYKWHPDDGSDTNLWNVFQKKYPMYSLL